MELKEAVIVLLKEIKQVCIDAGLPVDFVFDEDVTQGKVIEQRPEITLFIYGTAASLAGNLYLHSPKQLLRWAEVASAKSIEDLPRWLAAEENWLREFAKRKFQQLE